MRACFIRLGIGIAGGVSLAATVAIIVVGCGSSSGGTQPSSTTDGSSDSTIVMAPDSSEDAPIGQVDAADSGMDAITNPADAPYNFGVDVASIDAPTLQGFPPAAVQAYCARLGQCCLVSTASWNEALCVRDFTSGGGFRELSSFSASLDSGNVLYDAGAAAQCIADFTGFPCGAVTSSAILTEQAACYGALAGTLGIDAGPCRTSLECATNEYCAVTADSGTGVCEALHALAAPCTKATSEECSYLGLGTPALFCNLPKDGGQGQCESTLPNDAGCTDNNQCQTQLCSYPSCGPTIVFSDPGVAGGTCAFFTIQDAGGGG